MTSTPLDLYRLVVTLERREEGNGWHAWREQPGFRFLLTAGTLEECSEEARRILQGAAPAVPDDEENGSE